MFPIIANKSETDYPKNLFPNSANTATTWYNVFEFEDLAGPQSDMDFNDIVIESNDFAIV